MQVQTGRHVVKKICMHTPDKDIQKFSNEHYAKERLIINLHPHPLKPVAKEKKKIGMFNEDSK